MSDYAKYPYATLQAVGSKLTGITDDLGAHDKGAYSVDGLTDHQSRIHSAIDGFRKEWEASVKKLSENIGTFGDLSSKVGTMVGDFDDQVGKALRPSGK